MQISFALYPSEQMCECMSFLELVRLTVPQESGLHPECHQCYPKWLSTEEKMQDNSAYGRMLSNFYTGPEKKFGIILHIFLIPCIKVKI